MQKIRMVKRLLLVLAFVNSFGFAAVAQREYFVYLQTDSQQPFYVLLNKKNISSSAVGHLVLPKLKDSSYMFKVGFAGTSNQLDFEVTVDGADQGFLIKDFGEKGWGLFNLQTMAVQTAGAEKQKRAERAAALLAEQARLQQEVADAAMKQHAMLEKQRTDSIAAAQLILAQQAEIAQKQRLDSADAAQRAMAQKTDTKDSVATSNVGVTSQHSTPAAGDSIVKLAADTVSISMITVDSLVVPASSSGSNAAVKTLGRPDTIAVKADTVAMLSIDSQPIKLQLPKTVASPKFLDLEFGVDSTVAEVSTKATSLVKSDTVKAATTFVEVVADPKAPGITSNNSFTKIVRPAAPDTAANATQPKVEPTQPKTDSALSKADVPQPKINLPLSKPKVAAANCADTATEADFYVLRRQLIAFDAEPDAMVAIAKKSLAKKCYTTEHLRHLCMVFLNDTDKLAFLTMAQPFAADPDGFVSLGGLLTASGAKSGFEALLK